LFLEGKEAMAVTPVLPRGRIAKWTKEKIETLSTLELRQLLLNAQRLNEPEVAAICDAILDARPHGRAAAARKKRTTTTGRRPTKSAAKAEAE
jgi:hypothetical protein